MTVALLALVASVLTVTSSAVGESASSAVRPAQAGLLDAGEEHTCAVLADRTVRCWGRGLAGRLGYGNEVNQLSAGGGGPVNLGPGRTARAVAAGDYHTCAILDDATVRCWGFGANGRLGYGSTVNVTSPAFAPPVPLGPGRRAMAITAGSAHTCAILDDGTVRCWGAGSSGRMGLGTQASIGDDEVPGAVPPVDIGAGRRAVAIAAGDFHTCVIRDDGALVCWGFGQGGQLGHGGTADIGDDETPAAAGPVNLNGRRVRAVAGGTAHTCVVLDDGSARCWGFGGDGRLGYGGRADIPSAASAGPIALGPGRTAVGISAGEAHSCAILDTGAVRCWGFGGNGRLGYGSTDAIADEAGETPASAGPVALGAGRVAHAISLGFSHTCALLDDGTLRCWGFGGSGRLGYGNETSVGDSPSRGVAAAGPVPAGGAVPPRAADLSLRMAASVGQVALGGAAAVSVTVVNAGPDPAAGVSVALPPPAGIAYGAATATQGTFGGSVWQVGALGPGATATLQVAVSATAPGSHEIAAEVLTTSAWDPTSIPANGAAEDDRASVVFVVPQVARTGRQSTDGSKPRTRPLPRAVSVRAVRAPKRGRAKRVTVAGRLLPPRVRPAPRCAGSVRVLARAGKRTVAGRTVKLRRTRAGACTYRAVLRPAPKRVRRARLVVVTARFMGTPQMRPRASRGVRVRVR
ncbi:DUF11 domain-containing protein [Miltoncostaea marina]|uniref:RCC1 domain-containing protein n=1 Tax=Miltoncostaea marina TaxID=2843215 RepID=UPI001C3E53F1|nr:DUF11 domain-containing protein [Miltoncostaea marina]